MHMIDINTKVARKRRPHPHFCTLAPAPVITFAFSRSARLAWILRRAIRTRIFNCRRIGVGRGVGVERWRWSRRLCPATSTNTTATSRATDADTVVAAAVVIAADP